MAARFIFRGLLVMTILELIAMALFVLAATLGLVLYRKVGRGRTLGPVPDREQGVETATVVQE